MRGREISEMFSKVVSRYDFLNHMLSGCLDIVWRKKLVKLVDVRPGFRFLDIATGTGDVAVEFAKAYRDKSVEIVGIDFSRRMLDVAAKKIQKKGLGHIIKLEFGDAINLPFQDNTFDSVTMAFGIRNVEDYRKATEEMRRVVKKGGKIFILELSIPKNRFVAVLHRWYIKFAVPFLGGMFSRKEAYQYLADSIKEFSETVNIFEIMKSAGLSGVRKIPATLGIVSIYIGEKQELS